MESIYKITIPGNMLCYIGRTKNFSTRLKYHKLHYSKWLVSQTGWYSLFKMGPLDNAEIELLEETNDGKFRELHHIRENPNAVNIRRGSYLMLDTAGKKLYHFEAKKRYNEKHNANVIYNVPQ